MRQIHASRCNRCPAGHPDRSRPGATAGAAWALAIAAAIAAGCGAEITVSGMGGPEQGPTAATAPAAPSDLRAAYDPGRNAIESTFADNATGETGFRIEIAGAATAPAPAITRELAADVTGFTHQAPLANTRYVYRAVALGAATESAPSAPATAFTPPRVERPSYAAVATNAVRLSWADAARFELGFGLTRIEPGGSEVRIAWTGAGVTAAEDADLVTAATYAYRLTAAAPGGVSAAAAQNEQVEILWVKQNEGTVGDLQAGVSWQPADDGTSYGSRAGAAAACDGSGFGGHGDWRLPEANELTGLWSALVRVAGGFDWFASKRLNGESDPAVAPLSVGYWEDGGGCVAHGINGTWTGGGETECTDTVPAIYALCVRDGLE